MTNHRPTLDQIRHLIGHTESRALSPEESHRLRVGIEHLVASAAVQAANVTDLARRPGARARPALEVEAEGDT